MVKTGEMRALNDLELERRIHELRAEHFNLRFQLQSGQLENTNRLRQVHRDIARALTIQNERRIAASSEQ